MIEARQPLIDFLNDQSYSVIEINDRVFTVVTFEESNSGSYKHVLKGKDITKLSETYYNLQGLNELQKNEIITKVNELKARTKHFSNLYTWILHLPN